MHGLASPIVHREAIGYVGKQLFVDTYIAM
jgi:hypothetical protein